MSDINNSTVSTTTTDTNINKKNKIFKQIWKLGNKYLVIVDESIIHKLGITENSTFFVEQELMQDNTMIIMKIRNILDI